MGDGASVPNRPHPVQVCFFEAVPQRFRRQNTEILVETPHFSLPLQDQRLGTQDQDVIQGLTALQFAQYQACLYCLPDTNLVCYQQTLPVRSQKPEQWLELEGDELDSGCVECIERIHLGVAQAKSVQPGQEFLRAQPCVGQANNIRGGYWRNLTLQVFPDIAGRVKHPIPRLSLDCGQNLYDRALSRWVCVQQDNVAYVEAWRTVRHAACLTSDLRLRGPLYPWGKGRALKRSPGAGWLG